MKDMRYLNNGCATVSRKIKITMQIGSKNGLRQQFLSVSTQCDWSLF